VGALYRLATTAGGVLLLSAAALAQTGPPIDSHTGTIALEGTVEQEHAAVDRLAVKTIDGTKHVLHLAKSLVVHGGAKGGDDALAGLRAGTTVVVHYSGAGAAAAVQEIDLIGDDGLKVTEGTVTNIDRRRRQITIRFDDKTTETLQLTERAAQESGHDLEAAAAQAGRVTVYYADEGGRKVAHYFRKAS
jgi:hypothetical protein